MPLLYSFLFLTTGLSLWALCCFGIYSGLRVIETLDSRWITISGKLSLIFWFLFFLGTALLGGFGFQISVEAYNTHNVLGVGVALLFGLLFGGYLIRMASQGRIYGWRGLQLCALLFVGTHGILTLLMRWLFDNVWETLKLIEFASKGLTLIGDNEYDMTAVFLFLWLFPLSAPIFEMMFRSFRRAWQQNQTGTYTR